MKLRLITAVAAAALGIAAPMALADNGTTTTATTTTTTTPAGGKCKGQPAPTIDTSQVQADIAKLNADVQTRHQTLDTDIQALTADANGGASADTLKSDRAKTQSDFATNEAVVKQDRAQVESDSKALIQSVDKGCGARKAAHDQLETLRKSAAQALQAELVQFKQENQQLRDAAKLAVQQDRQQHHGQKPGKGKGGTTPTTTTSG
jgi:hypothetical protein